MKLEAHRALRDQLGVYTLGQLAGEELRMMQAHVQTCPQCQAEVDALVPVVAALRMVDPDRLDETPPTAPPRSPEVLSRRHGARRLGAMAPQLRAGVNLVAHEWGMEIKLTATGFTLGGTYRATVTDRAGRTVHAGEFIGTGDVEMQCNLNSSVLRGEAASFQVRDLTGDVVLVTTL